MDRVRIHAHPREAKRIESLAEAEIRTVADHGAVEIPRDLPGLSFQSASERALPEDGCWQQTAQTLVETLTETIRNGFGARVPDLVEAAELAGMSARSLQRRLKEAGYLFRERVDQARFDQALELL